jgi:CIC family chloride channel protein
LLPGPLRKRFGSWLRGSKSGLIALSILVGAGAGVGAVGFRYLILLVTWLFTGHRDYSGTGGAAHGLIGGAGVWFVIAAPIVGGLVYGPLTHFFAREAQGHGVPEVMLAVSENGGRIRPRVAIIKSLASAFTIGSGGSVGREGPIVQIGAALGSTLGQLTRLPEHRLRVLVACGAAGGISATFNAPIAGVFFALELILRDFEADSFGLVVLSSITADIIGRAAFGTHAFLQLPTFELRSPVEYVFYAGLGLTAAVVGVAFVKLLYGTEDLLDRIWRGPAWLRPAVGGLGLGLVLLAVPELYGVGYPPLERAIGGHYALGFLLLLLGGKIVATSLTLGIGGSGGVFAPSLFIGAMLGTAYGSGLHSLLPGVTGPAGAYGLIGMGAVFAATSRAPITAVIIIFELTGEYGVILPLMFAIVVAVGLSAIFSKDTIYSLKLRRRGVDIRRGRAPNPMALVTVAEAMQPTPEPLLSGASLDDAVEQLSGTGRDALPVIDPDGAFRGTITIHEVEDALNRDTTDVTVGDVTRETPALRSTQSLEQAVGTFVSHSRTGLPVLAPNSRDVIGWITHLDVLQAYNRGLERTRRARAGQPVPPPAEAERRPAVAAASEA